MQVHLIRHGETALQVEKRYQGITDAPLSPAGRAKLSRAAYCPPKVYVSPLIRARETASVMFPEAEQIVVPGLREMNFGAFEGRNSQEMEDDPAYRAWVDGMCEGRCPGGQSRAEYCRQVCTAFAGILDRALEDGEESVVIVAHGGTQMAVMERFCVTKKPYWEWMLGSGEGYVMTAEKADGEWEIYVTAKRRYKER